MLVLRPCEPTRANLNFHPLPHIHSLPQALRFCKGPGLTQSLQNNSHRSHRFLSIAKTCDSSDTANSARDVRFFFLHSETQQRHKIRHWARASRTILHDIPCRVYHSTNGRIGSNTKPKSVRLGLLLAVAASAATAIASPLAKRLVGPQGIGISNLQNTIDLDKGGIPGRIVCVHQSD